MRATGVYPRVGGATFPSSRDTNIRVYPRVGGATPRAGLSPVPVSAIGLSPRGRGNRRQDRLPLASLEAPAKGVYPRVGGATG